MPRAGGGGRLAARWVAVDAAAPLRPAEIEWDGSGRIVRVGRPTGPLADLCVLPGLVNAHAHLQLAPLARHATAEREFSRWLGAVMVAGAASTPAMRRVRLRSAVAALLAGGATSVGEIDSTGESPALLAATPLRARCYRELTGYHLDAAGARQLVRERLPRGRSAPGEVRLGLSPHAPYSASAELFRAAAARTAHLSIHCAEVPEEQQFLHTGRGPFADLLERLGRLPARHRAPGTGAVAWLERLGVLRARTLLVHCQELERGDVPRIVAAGASIAVCPGTIEWFGRAAPPVPAWLRAGVPVALGTDSIASNTALSLRAELARAARLWPGLAPRQLLAMATVHGGAALGLPGAGGLRVGARADFVVVPCTNDPEATIAAFVHDEVPMRAVVAGGRRLPARRPRR